MTPAKSKALSLKDCAAATPFSVDQIRSAIHATDPSAWPPPLKAKVTQRNADGRPRKYIVLEKDLDAWLESLPDA